MRAMTKSELARAAGVSRNTMRNWLKDAYIAKQLDTMNLKKKQKLPPNAVQLICEHYAITID